MSDEQPTENQGQNQEEIVQFIIDQLKQGAEKVFIAEKLTSTGMNIDEATKLVEEISAEAEAIAEEEALSPALLIPAAFGAVIASIIGGVVWGLIVILTDYELGIVAMGVGFLSGYAVVMFAKGKKGILLQIIASASSVVGILIGKYYMYHHYLKANVLEEYGEEAALDVTLLNPKVVQFFVEDIGLMLGGFDLIWAGLAVYIAWQIPQGSGFKK